MKGCDAYNLRVTSLKRSCLLSTSLFLFPKTGMEGVQDLKASFRCLPNTVHDLVEQSDFSTLDHAADSVL